MFGKILLKILRILGHIVTLGLYRYLKKKYDE